MNIKAINSNHLSLNLGSHEGIITEHQNSLEISRTTL